MEAAHSLGGRVFAADSSSLAPALFHADAALRVPPLDDPQYLPVLVDHIRQHDIGLVVPTIDTELPLLAAQRAEIERTGARVLISHAEFVTVTADKALTAEAFGDRGVAVPLGWTANELPPLDQLPERLFVKPRNGSSSKDAYATTRDDLAEVLSVVPNAIVQERLEGPETTIDALLALDGTPIHYVPRTRLKTLGGESIQGVTIPRAEMKDWIEPVLEVCRELGAQGPVTLQAFRTERGPVLLEVNPRFGGGFPLTRAAGGDYPLWLLRLAAGEDVRPSFGTYTEGLYMTRHMTETFATETLW